MNEIDALTDAYFKFHLLPDELCRYIFFIFIVECKSQEKSSLWYMTCKFFFRLASGFCYLFNGRNELKCIIQDYENQKLIPQQKLPINFSCHLNGLHVCLIENENPDLTLQETFILLCMKGDIAIINLIIDKINPKEPNNLPFILSFQSNNESLILTFYNHLIRSCTDYELESVLYEACKYDISFINYEKILFQFKTRTDKQIYSNFISRALEVSSYYGNKNGISFFSRKRNGIY